MHHGHLFPYFLPCWRITVVNGLEHLVLFAWPKLYEGLVKQVLSDGINGLQTEAMCFVIGRHILKTIAVDASVIEPIVDVVHDGDAMLSVAVILWQYAITDSLHQLCFICR